MPRAAPQVIIGQIGQKPPRFAPAAAQMATNMVLTDE